MEANMFATLLGKPVILTDEHLRPAQDPFDDSTDLANGSGALYNGVAVQFHLWEESGYLFFDICVSQSDLPQDMAKNELPTYLNKHGLVIEPPKGWVGDGDIMDNIHGEYVLQYYHKED